MKIGFSVLCSTSPLTWTGVLNGTAVELELLPEREEAKYNGEIIGPPEIFLPSLSRSSVDLSVTSIRTKAIVNNYSYIDPDGLEIFSWGPAKIKNSLVAIGRPSDLPEGVLLLVSLKDYENSKWDAIDFIEFLTRAKASELEACAAAGIEQGETGMLEPNTEAWAAASARSHAFADYYRDAAERLEAQAKERGNS